MLTFVIGVFVGATASLFFYAIILVGKTGEKMDE